MLEHRFRQTRFKATNTVAGPMYLLDNVVIVKFKLTSVVIITF